MKSWFKKIWHDNVWANVIAGLILAFLLASFKFLYIISEGNLKKESFTTIFNKLIITIVSKSVVPNWLLLIISFLSLTSLILIIRKIVFIFRSRIKPKEEIAEPSTLFNQELPLFTYGKPSTFFDHRLGKAFPALRDELKWYSGKAAVERLEILLATPLLFKNHTENMYSTPIWWFRCGRSMYIHAFKLLTSKKVLINNYDEFLINKIGVYRSNEAYQSFIYVETFADKRIMTNPSIDSETMKKIITRDGYISEEYGLLNNKPIKVDEYFDSAAEINGKVVDASDARLRKQFLSPYNFIITPHNSVYNSKRFDKESKEYFNGLIQNKTSIEKFMTFMQKFAEEETGTDSFWERQDYINYP